MKCVMGRYIKYKFNGVVSDYKKNMIVKLIEYARDFSMTSVCLEELWKKYNLPFPIDFEGFEAMLHSFDMCLEFCLQDEEGKLAIDYNEGVRHYTSSLMVNEQIIALDSIIHNFFQNPNCTHEERKDFVRNIQEGLIPINTWMFSCMLERNNQVSLEEARWYYPNSDYQKIGRSIRSVTDVVMNVAEYENTETSELKVKALWPNYVIMRMLFGFSALCALMCDSSDGSIKYGDALIQIHLFLQMHFHNALLYRLELPISKVNTVKSIGERGADDHVTLMKIFVFDRQRTPTLIRIDLPHVRTPELHFNVLDVTGKRRDDNHWVIKTEQTADELIPVINSLKEEIEAQIPHTVCYADTDSKDERICLQEMEKFNVFDELCIKTLMGKDSSVELKKLGGFFSLPELERTTKNVIERGACKWL